MEEYPSNSVTQSSETATRDGRVQQVTTGKVIIQKPGLGKRFAAAFKGEDGRSIWQQILVDTIIPGAKDMLFDAGQEALGRSLGIETRGRSRAGGIAYNAISSTLASRVNYNSPNTRPGFMTDPRERQNQPKKSTVLATTRGSVSYEDILLATRVEADEVILRMNQLIAQYGQVTIADLFDLVGVTGQYTDEKFGWVDLNGARPHRTGQGYALNLPRPVQLD